ncbi:LAGLIDADG family homing endonuclease [Haloplanus pelagicus]|uniref:LAGLIDADG family homing endonuclease n=1 Tax=Haloplanus pelagicus TaxID=2949995 RepID=UPI0031F31DBA
MSDTEGSAAGREIWIEKYRPQTLADVKGQDDIVDRLQSYIAQEDLPHLLFSGPAGIGKCVTGETPVLTNRGVERIGEIVDDVDGFAPPDDDLEVLTFDERGSFEFMAPSHVFGKTTDDLVRVTTRDGNELTVTPEHRLLTIGHDGLEWLPAGDLDAGTRVVRPRRSPLPQGTDRLNWIDAMDGDRTFVHVTEAFAAQHDIPAEESYVGIKKRAVAGFRRGESDDTIADAAGTPKKTVQSYRRTLDVSLDEPSTVCSLSYLRDIDVSHDELRNHVTAVQYVNRNNQRSAPITPPWELTPTLASFVGLAVSEARIDGGRVKFYNTDDGLLDRFETAAESAFGVEPRQGIQDGVPYREINTRTLTHFLESCFDAMGGTDGVGSALVRADGSSRAAFLRAVFDAEAHVTDGGVIELTQKNERLVTLLSYLLSGFGIPSRRKRERKTPTNGSGTEREYHTLYVSSSDHLERFADEIGFTIDRKAERLADNVARDSNPNDDTVPTQTAVDTLCEPLYLTKGDHVPESLNPESPGRERYLDRVDDLVDAATGRLEDAQRTLERIDELAADLDTTVAIPAEWLRTRGELEPIEMRRTLTEQVGVRPDRLLEYADGRRTPGSERTIELLDRLDGIGADVDIDHVRTKLADGIEVLGVPYAHVAEGTEMRGTDVQSLLDGGNDLGSLTRFRTVADRLRSVAAGMLSDEVLDALTTLHTLTDADLYFDEVESVERVDEPQRVYDLTVPGTRNYVAGSVPTVMHNTTCATAIAREVYGEDWRGNFLELNASDQRGIDVVRDRIKNFARSSFGGFDYRVIFLDEADSLCVPPGTEVVTGYPSKPEVKPIEEVSEEGEPIPSVDFETNVIQSDSGKLVDSGVADFFEMELEDGRTILASLSHPFFVVDEEGQLVEKELRDLSPGDEIADFKDDIGVSRCEICDAWTAGRFCSVDCKDEGHSRDMSGERNPMHGTTWSDERRQKIVEKLSDGRFAGENNPNYGGAFHGTHVWEMDDETVARVRETISEMRSGTSWEEWVVDADPERVKDEIGEASSEWWASLSDEEKAAVIEKSVENCDYPVCDIRGDNNPMRDPEVARKVSDALQGHDPTGGNVRHSDELGHLVRSDWEYEVGTALQDANIDYEYEPAFELSESVYHPDFLVDDTVIEVKGVAELWGQTEKVEEFLETYGDEYTFVVVGDGDLPHHEHYERSEFDPAVLSDGGLQSVPTVGISRIEHSHRGEAYNISMEGTPNFMLANGILTHNTSDAQSALRRTMEQFADNTRFILSCNYSSRIIDPIQSRCAVFRFSPLPDDAIEAQAREIAEAEGIEVTDAGIDALVYAAGGDMRRAINTLQAAATTGEVVDEEAVYTVTSTARPEEIESMVEAAIEGDFPRARSTLETLLVDSGMAGGDVIDQLHRSAWEFDLGDRRTVQLMERLGEADYRITEGANERVQLEAMLAALALEES